METFLIVVALIFFLFSLTLLLSPHVVHNLAELLNRVLFTIDDKIHGWRKPIAIIFLVLAIFFLWVAIVK